MVTPATFAAVSRKKEKRPPSVKFGIPRPRQSVPKRRRRRA
jgi:hypothetical protein